MNLVHAYGIASAQHYWGRTAAPFNRILYYTFGEVLDAFVYVDDYSVLVRDTNPTHALTRLLILTETYGLPIAYHKIKSTSDTMKHGSDSSHTSRHTSSTSPMKRNRASPNPPNASHQALLSLSSTSSHTPTA